MEGVLSCCVVACNIRTVLYIVFALLPVFFAMKEELYYMIVGYINTSQALWITK
jgi:hypothetical protein